MILSAKLRCSSRHRSCSWCGATIDRGWHYVAVFGGERYDVAGHVACLGCVAEEGLGGPIAARLSVAHRNALLALRPSMASEVRRCDP